MKPRKNDLDGVMIALEILKRIPRVRKVSAKEIHTQLFAAGYERNLRSIQRQLDVLSGRFDIERDVSSEPYGYRWKEKAAGLSLGGFTEKEAVLFALAEAHLKPLLPPSLMRSMASFFDQANAVLKDPNAGGAAREWRRKVRVVSTTQPLLPPKLSRGVFEAVAEALYRDHWLEIEYRNISKFKQTAKVMPLGLAQQGSRHYLICRFDGYDDERSLALHRMLKAKDTGLAFKRPGNFDLARYDAEGRFGFGQGKVIKLKIRIGKDIGEHIVESPLSLTQEVLDVGNDYEISASVVESDQLVWWLRGFGKHVQVLEPKDLMEI